MTALTRPAIAAVDSTGQLDDVLGLPDHLRDALWKAESAGLTEVEAAGGLIVAGMGGSSIGGALAKAALGDHVSRPIGLARGYELPSWATPDTLILCSSYSGDTEETLACYEAAGALGAPRIVAASGGRLAAQAHADGVPVIPIPGGFQPRAAVGYGVVAALEAAAVGGVAPSIRSEIDVAAAHLEQLVAAWGPDAPEDCLPKAIAAQLRGTVPVVIGAGATVPVAYRWKTQFNENAKVPAFAGELPEVDHNEVAGWTGAAALGRFTAVFLDDSDLHPRVRERIALTRGIVEDEAAGTVTASAKGDSCTERVLSLVLLGDLVTVYLAALNGTDPVRIEAIDRLKAELDGE